MSKRSAASASAAAAAADSRQRDLNAFATAFLQPRLIVEIHQCVDCSKLKLNSVDWTDENVHITFHMCGKKCLGGNQEFALVKQLQQQQHVGGASNSSGGAGGGGGAAGGGGKSSASKGNLTPASNEQQLQPPPQQDDDYEPPLKKIAFSESSESTPSNEHNKLFYGRYSTLLQLCELCAGHQAAYAAKNNVLEKVEGADYYRLHRLLCQNCAQMNISLNKTHVSYFHPKWNKFSKS